jgi:hypothetical protein
VDEVSWGNLVLALAATVFSLLAIEGFLRLTNAFGARVSWAQADSRVTWRFAPGSEYWRHDENNHPITGRINSFGWRDREWERRPAPGIRRIAVLGDSFVEAMQVEKDSTHLALAERRVRERTGQSVELMNFGRSGSTQSEQLLFLVDDVLRFQPEMVFLFFFPGNDVAEVRRETAPYALRPFFHEDERGALQLDTSFAESPGFRGRKAIDGLKRRSALVSLMADRWNLLTRRHHEPSSARETLKVTYLSLCTDTPSEALRESFELNQRLIIEIARESRRAGSEFVLFTLDNPAFRPAVADSLRRVDPSFDPRCFEHALEALARDNGFQHVGLHSTFERTYRERREPLHFGGNGHWNYAGHHAVADALTEFLVGRLEDRGETEILSVGSVGSELDEEGIVP